MSFRHNQLLLLTLLILLTACARQPAVKSPTETLIETSPTATNNWLNLQERTPYPHNTPLPATERTLIDGTYAKFDETWPQWWACRRCADYRPAGGIWKLRFDQGVMRIYYNVTGWTSIASYEIKGDRLFLFNDPYCPDEVGEYRWRLEDRWGLADRFLTLKLVEDGCSIRLRGENLSAQEWGACFPPNEMTGASDHFRKPVGCEDPLPSQLRGYEVGTLSVDVTVYKGEARQFVVKPDVIANANSDEMLSPEGIEVRHNDESIPYGLSRVLWGEGSWVEAVTSEDYESIGVQIFGDYTIGWARVLFDSEEVWRGNTAEIWNEFGRFGGYIEVTSFTPGEHVIRVESLGFDYHPVTVAFFGFSHTAGLQVEE
ncbi:MAG: hypothetical protein DWQ07_09805 [Chloroflexi bacterium]|nr:MAG: hypothetical protein DWQ07_09805 [Chloroflexota bacterium]MBL1192992.1 hypothetical protein [Chloroflexota bacterium]NOH10285.1 hypothetical protein [Chloroflexota bacterium]